MAYSQLDREAAVALVIEENAAGRTLENISADLGVAAVTLRYWKASLRPEVKLRRGPAVSRPPEAERKDAAAKRRQIICERALEREGDRLDRVEREYIEDLGATIAAALGVKPERLEIAADLGVCKRRIVIRRLTLRLDGSPAPELQRSANEYVRLANE